MNLDHITNHNVKTVARTAFKLLDKLGMERRDTQLAGAALFFWAVCKGLKVEPSRLIEAIERTALDGDRKQVPAVGALIMYVQNELKEFGP